MHVKVVLPQNVVVSEFAKVRLVPPVWGKSGRGEGWFRRIASARNKKMCAEEVDCVFKTLNVQNVYVFEKVRI